MPGARALACSREEDAGRSAWLSDERLEGVNASSYVFNHVRRSASSLILTDVEQKISTK
jgi:hypothetical protein